MLPVVVVVAAPRVWAKLVDSPAGHWSSKGMIGEALVQAGSLEVAAALLLSHRLTTSMESAVDDLEVAAAQLEEAVPAVSVSEGAVPVVAYHLRVQVAVPVVAIEEVTGRCLTVVRLVGAIFTLRL